MLSPAHTDESALEAVPHILLVDDRPSNLTALGAILDRVDYHLVYARSGQEALTQVLRADFAVILLDVAMPGMDGFETATLIKQRERSKLIPIIFVTAAVGDTEQIFRGYNVGAVDYLVKPLDPHQVRAKVGVFVQLWRQRQQIERQAAQLREVELREQMLRRQRAEAALRESEAAYELTFYEAPVGIGHATPEGAWTRTNARLREILGYEHASLVGRSVLEGAEGADAICLSEALARLRSGGARVHGAEYRLRSATGNRRWVRMHLAALGDGSAVTRLVAVVDDITDRKAIELERARLLDELRDAVRARDDFLSIATHELHTPITPLRLQSAGLVAVLRGPKAGALDRERIIERLARIDAAAERLQRMIDRLLDVSRVTLGRMKLDIEEVDLVELARDVCSRLGPEAERAATPISLHTDGPVVGRWDRLRIEQVVMNLVSNAIKYGEAKPITVTVSPHDRAAHLVVRDHGLGIAKESQERIFERFERIAPVRHHASGFGLGLWIARQIVEAHGGTITVDSRPGEGSAFTVDLPVARHGEIGPRPAKPNNMSQKELH
jgi:PAS domain S-box-containing protein